MDKEQEKFFKKFGKNVRKLRLEKKMTLEDMQDYGFSPQHFQKIETGNKAIGLYTAYRICKSLNINLDKITK